MKQIEYTPAENPYYQSPPATLLSINISKYLSEHLNVSYFNLLLAYGKSATSTTDLFQFFNKPAINRLRNDKNTLLFYDCTFEGYSGPDKILSQALEYSCKVHNINPKKIFLFTGNLKDIAFETSINVIPIFVLNTCYQPEDVQNLRNFEKSKSLCNQNYSNIVLSLSRRNRNHRIWAHFMLSKSEIFKDCIVSQDKIEDNFYLDNNTLKKINLTRQDFEEFKNSLPMLADGDNFHINTPFDPLTELHSRTAFSIVNETHADNYNNTSLFFSEKAFKPVLNFQPMLIYGQQGINKKLNMLGFKSYESYFDLDFDREPDNFIRYKKLLATATDTVRYLNSLTREDQIEWRYKERNLLEFNNRMFFSIKYLLGRLTVLKNLITSIT